MVNIIGWASIIFMIGFGAGRLRLHAVSDRTNARTRPNKKLSPEQMSNLLFGIYVGLTVAAIQKSTESFDISHSPQISAFVLAVLSLIVGLIIQYLFINKTETQSRSSPSTADEIEKLASLLDRGLLSQEEFDSQKSRLINP